MQFLLVRPPPGRTRRNVCDDNDDGGRPGVEDITEREDVECSSLLPPDPLDLTRSMTSMVHWADSREVRLQIMAAVRFPFDNIPMFLVAESARIPRRTPADRSGLRPRDNESEHQQDRPQAGISRARRPRRFPPRRTQRISRTHPHGARDRDPNRRVCRREDE